MPILIDAVQPWTCGNIYEFN